MTAPIAVDGAMGEGGGQVLRTALSLSLLTRQSFRLSRIRANRQRPGLRPQHLAAVQAAAQVSGARVSGDRVGSEAIELAPGPVRPGDYFFDIGTAGATALVLQTLLLPLALAPGRSSVTIRGGTHVPLSPCFHYLDWNWRPFLARIGIQFDLTMTMTMAGFYPQGGGELPAGIPGHARPGPLDLTEPGVLRGVRGLSAVANLPREIAERQRCQALRRLRALLPEVSPEVILEELPASPGAPSCCCSRNSSIAKPAALHSANGASVPSKWRTRRCRRWPPLFAATGPSTPGWPNSFCCRLPWIPGRRPCAPARSPRICSPTPR